MKRFTLSLAAALLAAFANAALAADDDANIKQLEQMQITATREPEPVSRVPASITVVSGNELRARGANDLRTALSLVAGVEGTPGGDSGPAGSVPALWGLREQDAYLLVIDGVPWGGAFNPATPSVDLNGVERIEILRGAAPVMFGATSFNGVIHIIHYAAGAAPATVSVFGGSYGSVGGSGTASLPAIGGFNQSVSASIEKRGYSVDREDYKRYHLLYRGATNFDFGRFHIDADATILPQKPSNLLFRGGPNGPQLHDELFSFDANHNPSDAKLNQKRFHVALGFDSDVGIGTWSTTVAYTRTLDDIIRGFLRNYAPTTGNQANPNTCAGTPDPNEPDGKCDDFDADGFSQKRQVTDVYFDTHLTTELGPTLTWTNGLDYLYGKGRQNAVNFGYFVSLDGKDAPPGSAQHPDEIVFSQDRRNFAGLYTQIDWRVAPSVDVLAGLRLNHTRESAVGQAIANDMDQMEVEDIPAESRNKTRLSGVVGASWNTFKQGRNSLTFYADYRNTYKPLAVDFGPEAEVSVLQPETSGSYEAGVKGSAFEGRYEYDMSAFLLDFRNGLTFESGVARNGGKQRFQGVEYEGRYAITPDLKLAASYSYHDSRFKKFTKDDGGVVDNNRLEMAPYHLAGVGLMYFPAQGFNGSLLANYVGERKLNKTNSVSAGGYVTLDAGVGYNFGRLGLHVNGYNLTDRRVPVAESELAAVASGASSYFLLPARSVIGSVSLAL